MNRRKLHKALLVSLLPAIGDHGSLKLLTDCALALFTVIGVIFMTSAVSGAKKFRLRLLDAYSPCMASFRTLQVTLSKE